ncbi:MAG: hypothetical protein PHC92_06620 [Syntrophomonadaceae bacterium]|nr:hypothetical protein [Syntrophomonadaceae bacterium]
MSMVKDEAKKLIENLPEEATWDDIMYEFYVRNKIENALRAVEEGKIISHEEARKRLLKQ